MDKRTASVIGSANTHIFVATTSVEMEPVVVGLIEYHDIETKVIRDGDISHIYVEQADLLSLRDEESLPWILPFEVNDIEEAT